MTELEAFMANIKDKSVNTQRAYKTQYNKLYNLIGKPIGDTSEAKILEAISTLANTNQKQASINIGIHLRRMKDPPLSVLKLEAKRDANKKVLRENVKNTNLKLQETLPSYDTLIEYMNSLYEAENWTDYIINYLLLNFQTRNADLLFDIIKRRKDATSDEKNYIWLTRDKAVFIRNVYKTADSYGRKINEIYDIKFLTALKRVIACKKQGEDCGVFIPTISQVGYYIQKATYKGLGEGNYFKIVVAHFREDLIKIKEISDNRGTNIATILSNYDIANV
jgi:hypothetical protein